jgi:hypothetical protein
MSRALLIHRLRTAVRSIRRALWRHVGRFLAQPPLRFGREARRERPMEYLVLWEILVEADSPEEAADEALAAQRNPDSRATVFDVRDEWGRWRRIACSGDEVTGGRRALRLVKRSPG